MSRGFAVPAWTRNRGLAVGSLACGLVGLFFLSFVLGPAAIILGRLAHRESPSDLAKAGLVVGAIDVVLALVLLATKGFSVYVGG